MSVLLQIRIMRIKMALYLQSKAKLISIQAKRVMVAMTIQSLPFLKQLFPSFCLYVFRLCKQSKTGFKLNFKAISTF